MYNLFFIPALFIIFLYNPIKNLNKEYAKVRISDKLNLTVEIANTKFKQSKGLMFTKPLSKKEGMFFIFKNSKKRSFYNKNVSFNVLLFWINQDFTIVGYTVLNKNSFNTHTSPNPIKYVLELNYDLFTVNPNSLVGKKVNLEFF